ncbi:hypothetical protein ABW19_dt0208440 [Dactylella cylindrospora]|nr:hypothetical protein ABW19_dt0208440 [Dactylella cylindrospora]
MNSSTIYITIGYYQISLAEKLSWPPPNPNPPRKGHYLVPFDSVMLGISTTAMILRLYSRAFIVYRLGIDDLLIIPGYLSAVTLTVAQIISLRAGWGVHVQDFDLANARLLALTGYIVQMTIALCCLFTKLSILLSYLRFSPKSGYWFWGLRFWVKVTMVFITVWTLSLTFTLVLSCNPPHIYWDTYIRTPEQAAKCISPYKIRVIQYTICSLNILSDIIVMILPIPTIWSLQMPKRQKWSCILIFLVWAVATVAAILRLWMTIKAFEAFDSSWVGYDLWIYVALEAHLAVACACAPGFKPLIVKVWPKFDKMRSSDRGKNSGGSTGLTPSAPTDSGVYELKPTPKHAVQIRRHSDAWLDPATQAGESPTESASNLVGPDVGGRTGDGSTGGSSPSPPPHAMKMETVSGGVSLAAVALAPPVPQHDAKSGGSNLSLMVSTDGPPPAYPSWSPNGLRDKAFLDSLKFSSSLPTKFTMSLTLERYINNVSDAGSEV